MSRRLAEAASRVLAKRTPRRGFLAKSAVVGSAIAVAPTEFLLKPKSAYAAICSCAGSSCDCAALCCDGFTEFCCTMYGTNGCPPGSYYGGWWKVDNSNFCNGGARYYLDCHNPCGGCGCNAGGGLCSGGCNGTPCGCANGSCGNRRAGCNHFRYGQCNQQIACLGPIICRVITCTAPWVLEPNCTMTALYDESTRNHDGPCLHGTGQAPVGSIDRAWSPQPGRIRVIGWALDRDRNRAINVAIAVDGQTVRTVLADRFRPDVAASYPGHGANHGFAVTVNAPEGPHALCVTAIDPGTSPDTTLGCRAVAVAAPADPGA